MPTVLESVALCFLLVLEHPVLCFCPIVVDSSMVVVPVCPCPALHIQNKVVVLGRGGMKQVVKYWEFLQIHVCIYTSYSQITNLLGGIVSHFAVSHSLTCS